MDAKQAPGGWRLARPRLAESSVPGSLAGATSRAWMVMIIHVLVTTPRPPLWGNSIGFSKEAQ